MDNKVKGNLGEDEAVAYLERHGYEIIVRNYRIRNAEIDIIAKKHNTISFVEVKYRKTNALGTPAEAVDEKKQKKIILAAEGYIAEHGEDGDEFRFDVCEVTPKGVNLIKDAFWA